MYRFPNDRIGSYPLVQLLGQGGFSQVYLSEDAQHNPIVIKLFYPDRNSQTMSRSFQRELKILKMLNHPRIMHILDGGEIDEWKYIVMPFLPNGTLRQRYPMGRQLPLQVIMGVLKELAEGFSYLQQNQVVHGDIKPENILIAENSGTVISDFGIAKIVGDTHFTTTQTQVAGSVHYMAPELFEEKAVISALSDEYAFAVMVYNLLSGFFPFDSGSLISIATSHINNAPPSLRNGNHWVTPPIENVIFKALSKRPEDRYPNIAALVAELEIAEKNPSVHSQLPVVSTFPFNITKPSDLADKPGAIELQKVQASLWQVERTGNCRLSSSGNELQAVIPYSSAMPIPIQIAFSPRKEVKTKNFILKIRGEKTKDMDITILFRYKNKKGLQIIIRDQQLVLQRVSAEKTETLGFWEIEWLPTKDRASFLLTIAAEKDNLAFFWGQKLIGSIQDASTREGKLLIRVATEWRQSLKLLSRMVTFKEINLWNMEDTQP